MAERVGRTKAGSDYSQTLPCRPTSTQVLEARSELDSLEALAACPLLQLHPARFQPFLQDAPQLLSAATSVQQLHARLQQLLFPGEPQLRPWA